MPNEFIMTNDGPFFRRSNGETPFPEQPYITIAYKLTSASVSDAKNGSIINLTFTSVCSFIFFFFFFFSLCASILQCVQNDTGMQRASYVLRTEPMASYGIGASEHAGS